MAEDVWEQAEVKKVMGTGGMGSHHVWVGKAPQSRPFACPASQEQAPAPPGEMGMP